MARIPRILALLAALFVTACACDCRKPDELGETRRVLAEGYSMLNKDSFTISSVRGLLYVKQESDDFDRYVTAVSEYGSQLHDDLQRLSKEYPAVRTDLDPLPVLEKRKRLATGWDKFKDVAPVTGKSGRAWERTLLISLVNGLNQERHLAEEMAKIEPNAQLQKWLREQEAAMTKFWEQGEALLEKRYYK
jgi:hypothetical protein